MGFLQPLALFGLAAVAIPPLLHLLDRRLPPVVIFPAVRYLVATEREHSRRLRLRNLILLFLRMAILLLLVLAAARPVVRSQAGRGHDPTALGMVLDNSLSSGAVAGGEVQWARLVRQAQDIVERLTADDALWIVTADGEVWPHTRAVATAMLDTLSPAARRLDLAAATDLVATALGQATQPQREIVVLSDGQASAFLGSVAEHDIPTLLLEPRPTPPPNRGIDSVRVERGAGVAARVFSATVGGDGDRAAAAVKVGDRSLARTVLRPGETGVLTATLPVGWHAVAVELDPDELRADDRYWVAVRVHPPAAVSVHPGAGSFVAGAVDVLAAAGRLRAGSGVWITDRLERPPAVIVPPEDRALLGAFNRRLAARGIRWQFGAVVDGGWVLAADFPGLAGVAVHRIHLLLGAGDVLASAGEHPWLVRDGSVVLLASRMDPAWTDLPVRAGFVPFIDALANRVDGGGGWVVRARPGDRVMLPASGREVLVGETGLEIPADRRVRVPAQPGVYFVVGGSGDTVGALETNHDSRESRLHTVKRESVRASLGPTARVVSADELERDLFAGARRADLTTALLVAALLVGVGELLVATFGRRSHAD